MPTLARVALRAGQGQLADGKSGSERRNWLVRPEGEVMCPVAGPGLLLAWIETDPPADA